MTRVCARCRQARESSDFDTFINGKVKAQCRFCIHKDNSMKKLNNSDYETPYFFKRQSKGQDQKKSNNSYYQVSSGPSTYPPAPALVHSDEQVSPFGNVPTQPVSSRSGTSPRMQHNKSSRSTSSLEVPPELESPYDVTMTMPPENNTHHYRSMSSWSAQESRRPFDMDRQNSLNQGQYPLTPLIKQEPDAVDGLDLMQMGPSNDSSDTFEFYDYPPATPMPQDTQAPTHYSSPNYIARHTSNSNYHSRSYSESHLRARSRGGSFCQLDGAQNDRTHRATRSYGQQQTNYDSSGSSMGLTSPGDTFTTNYSDNSRCSSIDSTAEPEEIQAQIDAISPALHQLRAQGVVVVLYLPGKGGRGEPEREFITTQGQTPAMGM